jgi:hypothetical protein
LATVATSGSYNDLINKPSGLIPADRTAIGSYAFLVSLKDVVSSSGTNVTGYTYAAGQSSKNTVVFASTAFTPNFFTSQRLSFFQQIFVKGPTLAPGTWRIINPIVGVTDLLLETSGTVSQLAQDTGFYAVCFAVRVA